MFQPNIWLSLGGLQLDVKKKVTPSGGEWSALCHSCFTTRKVRPQSALNWRLGRPHGWSGHGAEKINLFPCAKNIVLDHPAHNLVAVSTMLSWLQMVFFGPCRKYFVIICVHKGCLINKRIAYVGLWVK
jgi:hypothetical protein